MILQSCYLALFALQAPVIGDEPFPGDHDSPSPETTLIPFDDRASFFELSQQEGRFVGWFRHRHERSAATQLAELLTTGQLENGPTLAIPWLRASERETQPVLFGQIFVEKARVVMASVKGARALFVNGEASLGSQATRRFGGVPISLQSGVNHLFAAQTEPGFELEIWSPESNVLLGTRTRLGSERLLPTYDPTALDRVIVPLFSTSLDGADEVHVHFGDPVPEDMELRTETREWADGARIAPLCLSTWSVPVLPIASSLGIDRDFAEAPWTRALMPIAAYVEGEDVGDRRLVRLQTRQRATEGRPRHGTFLGAPMDARKSLFVVGTRGLEAERGALLALARVLQQALAVRHGEAPSVWTDEQFLRASQEDRDSFEAFVLFGTADTNGAWTPISTGLRVEDLDRDYYGTSRPVRQEGRGTFGFSSLSRVDESTTPKVSLFQHADRLAIESAMVAIAMDAWLPTETGRHVLSISGEVLSIDVD